MLYETSSPRPLPRLEPESRQPEVSHKDWNRHDGWELKTMTSSSSWHFGDETGQSEAFAFAHRPPRNETALLF